MIFLSSNFDEINDEAESYLKYILDNLNNNYEFYEADISYEYTSFEESIKKYCDSYFEFYLVNSSCDVLFNALISVFEVIIGIDSSMYYENFFRPVELMTYYLGKLVISEAMMKNKVYSWINKFIECNEEDMIVEEYFIPFINGEKIYHADEYYTDYDDFNKVVRVFKD